YTADGFLDEDSLKRAVCTCVSSVLQNYDGEIKEIYVGVPAFFTEVLTKGQTISFPTKRKLAVESFDALYEAGLTELGSRSRFIKRSEMYFSVYIFARICLPVSKLPTANSAHLCMAH
ncbi:MAG: hypothetical protein IJN64_01325, partial [Lachnospiraceae bacterium]|nr:hypothetical protein [Lachnospiraceae bacterium]